MLGGTPDSRLRRPGLLQDARQARAHIAGLGDLPALLDRLGESTDLILGCAGLTRESFADPYLSASFADLDRLLHACVERTKCQHLGLLLGSRFTLEAFGLIGRLARHADTVGEALADLEQFFCLHDSGGTLQVTVADGQALLSYCLRVPGLRSSDQIHDLCAAACCSILRQLYGDGFRPREVLVPHRRPQDARRYEEILAAPVRFDTLHCGVTFPASALAQSVAGADKMLHSLLRDHAASAIAESDALLFSEVRRAIADSLAAGDCSRGAVARRLGLHERALGRRLQADDTTFQALRDEMRAQQARQLLHDTDAPVARIATSLGYADSTVFSRAFHRRTGMTPREFRAGSRKTR